MYREDSFFTLTEFGQAGLAGLSALLSVLVLVPVFWLVSKKRIHVRLAIALAAFWLFVWISPQIYYAYYRIIIDGLPQQWVIGWPAIFQPARYMTFTGPQNLSAHGQGLLGWSLVLLAVFRR